MVKTILTLLFLYFTSLACFAQNSDSSPEDLLDKTYGMEKLILLNQLSEKYLNENSRKAVRYGKQAVALAENLFPQNKPEQTDTLFYIKVDAYNRLGTAQFVKEHLYDSKVAFSTALEFGINASYNRGITHAENYLARLDSIGVKSNIFKQTFNELGIGEVINDGSQDLSLSIALKSAEVYERNGNYESAIKNYEKAIHLYMDSGEDEQIPDLYRRIADNYNKLGNISKSLEYYDLTIEEQKKSGDTVGLKSSREGIKEVEKQINDLVETREIPVRQIRTIEIDTTKKNAEVKERADFKRIAEESEANEDFETSLKYYKLYTELNNQLAEDEKMQELAILEKNYEIERNLQEIQLLIQDKEIQELDLQNKELQIEKQNKFRNNLFIGLSLLFALVLALLMLYRIKRREHKRLNKAHEELKSTQQKLITAEKRIKNLLSHQLSSAVAHELLSESTEEKIMEKLVCIMFLDIRDFTKFAESRSPEDIIKYQNDVFSFMIDAIYKHHGIINQFLGDGFMATFGAPVSKGNDSENAYRAAVEIIETVNEKSKTGEIPFTKIGIGLHSGKVVAGNVGTSLRKQYSITGNPVIIASRIEQLNKKFNSQLLASEDVLEHIQTPPTNLEMLGKVELKGRADPIQIIKFL